MAAPASAGVLRDGSWYLGVRWVIKWGGTKRFCSAEERRKRNVSLLQSKKVMKFNGLKWQMDKCFFNSLKKITSVFIIDKCELFFEDRLVNFPSSLQAQQPYMASKICIN